MKKKKRGDAYKYTKRKASTEEAKTNQRICKHNHQYQQKRSRQLISIK